MEVQRSDGHDRRKLPRPESLRRSRGLAQQEQVRLRAARNGRGDLGHESAPKGDKFDLDINRRVDSDRWLEVTGKVVHEHGLVSIEATRLKLATPPQAIAENDEPTVPAAPLEPVKVVFSSPTEGETDVASSGTIRIQFSRGLREPTLANLVRVSYVGAAAGASAATLPFALSYDGASRSIQIKMKQPFESFRTVRVELLEGIKGFDGGPVTPWTVTFSVGN